MKHVLVVAVGNWMAGAAQLQAVTNETEGKKRLPEGWLGMKEEKKKMQTTIMGYVP